jgi:hypothetical protein
MKLRCLWENCSAIPMANSPFCAAHQDGIEPPRPAPLSGLSLPPRKPIPCDDLKRRLELLHKYGVRSYRDGVLSIDLDPNLLRNRKPHDPDEQPIVPEM